MSEALTIVERCKVYLASGAATVTLRRDDLSEFVRIAEGRMEAEIAAVYDACRDEVLEKVRDGLWVRTIAAHEREARAAARWTTATWWLMAWSATVEVNDLGRALVAALQAGLLSGKGW